MSASGPLGHYDYWLFDLDGTLVDTDWAYKRQLFDRVGAQLGVEFSDAAVSDIWYGFGGKRDGLLRSRGLDPVEFWGVFDEYDDPVARAEATHLYPDARWIADLGVPTAIVTHCPEPVTDRVLRAVGIRDWFTTVVPCDDATGWKPDPAPVECAIDALPVTADATGIMIGDGEPDIGAAINAGLTGVHVERHDPSRRGRCVLGDYRVRDLAELRDHLGSDPTARVSALAPNTD